MGGYIVKPTSNKRFQIDVAPMPDHTLGSVAHVDIAADRTRSEDSVWRKDDIRPVCGNPTLVHSRIAVTIYPYFASGFSYGLSALGHQSCFAAYKETAQLPFLGNAAVEQALASGLAGTGLFWLAAWARR